MKLHPFCTIEPINYKDIASDSNRHLQYQDYKHLKDVEFISNKELTTEIIGLISLLLVIFSVTLILFLA